MEQSNQYHSFVYVMNPKPMLGLGSTSEMAEQARGRETKGMKQWPSHGLCKAQGPPSVRRAPSGQKGSKWTEGSIPVKYPTSRRTPGILRGPSVRGPGILGDTSVKRTLYIWMSSWESTTAKGAQIVRWAKQRNPGKQRSPGQ